VSLEMLCVLYTLQMVERIRQWSEASLISTISNLKYTRVQTFLSNLGFVFELRVEPNTARNMARALWKHWTVYIKE